MKTQLLNTVATLSVVLCTASLQAQTNDMLWQHGPRGLVSGEIKRVTRDFITIIDKGRSQNISVDQVSKLRFKDDPSGLASIRSAVVTGQLEQAATQMQSIKPRGRPFVRQDVEFYRALIDAKLALQGRSPINDAARKMSGFLKAHPDSFRYYEACEMMGNLAMGLQRFDSAAKYYAKLGESKSSSVAARGNLLQGDAWLRRGDPKKAAQLFQQVATSSDVRLQSLGQIGVATCLSQNGKATEAIQQIEKVIGENDSKDTELFARAYNALGLSFAAAGRKEAALEAFLHTDLLFYRESEQHAEALFHLSKLWSDANNPAEATRAKQTLKQRYGSSLWASK